MNAENLLKLRNSSDAPFNHEEYTVWLHNKIIDDIQQELWKYREAKESDPMIYVLCNKIFKFESLQRIQ